jgi:ornithine decarboxylase
MLSIIQLHNFIDEIKSRQIKTPFMLTDLSIIEEKCRIFRKYFPDINLYYSLKSFSDEQVIKTIEPLVFGFDVASIYEIQSLINLGISPKRLLFGNPVKSTDMIKKSARLGVNKFAFQSKAELIKISKNAPHSEVYIRIKAGDSKGAIVFSSKFGCDPNEAVDLLKVAGQLGLIPNGITFHIGSQSTDIISWSKAVENAQSIAKKAQAEGVSINHINVGGGFPVQFSTNDPSIDDIAASVNKAITAVPELNYIAEPGRFLVADSSVIVASVIGVEDRDTATWLFIDTSTFNAFAEVFEFHNFPYPVYSLSHIQKRLSSAYYKNYVLTGPTCDSFDTMAESIKLPADISIGSKLIITVAGAYTVVYGSRFNGFDIPLRYFFRSKTLKTEQKILIS